MRLDVREVPHIAVAIDARNARASLKIDSLEASTDARATRAGSYAGRSFVIRTVSRRSGATWRDAFACGLTLPLNGPCSRTLPHGTRRVSASASRFPRSTTGFSRFFPPGVSGGTPGHRAFCRSHEEMGNYVLATTTAYPGITRVSRFYLVLPMPCFANECTHDVPHLRLRIGLTSACVQVGTERR